MWLLYTIGYVILIIIFIFWGLYTLIAWLYKIIKKQEAEGQKKLQIERDRELMSNTFCSTLGCNHTRLSNYLRRCEFCSLLFCEEHIITKEFNFLGKHSFCYQHQNHFLNFQKREEELLDKERIEQQDKRKRQHEYALEIKRKRTNFENQKAINPNTICCSESDCYEVENLTPCRDCGKMICLHHIEYSLCKDCRIIEIND